MSKCLLLTSCCKNIAPNIPAAITHLYAEDEDTISYLKDLDNMHKVVLEVSF